MTTKIKLPKAFSNLGHDDRTKLFKQLPKKIQILLACSYARLSLPTWNKHYPDDNRPLTAIETTEGYVLGTHSIEQVRAAAHAASAADASAAASAAAYVAYVAYAAAYAAAYAVHAAVHAAVSAGVPWEDIYKLYLHTKGPHQFQPEWKTSDVVALVNGIVKDRAFDRMPILADALQDAGLTDPELLTHLQQDQCYLSDWTVWNVMGWK